MVLSISETCIMAAFYPPCRISISWPSMLKSARVYLAAKQNVAFSQYVVVEPHRTSSRSSGRSLQRKRSTVEFGRKRWQKCTLKTISPREYEPHSKPGTWSLVRKADI